jgi:hypothetical protein
MYAIDHRRCARSLITAQNFHGARREAMAVRATRETRVYVECARSRPFGSSALAGTDLHFCCTNLLYSQVHESCAI